MLRLLRLLLLRFMLRASSSSYHIAGRVTLSKHALPRFRHAVVDKPKLFSCRQVLDRARRMTVRSGRLVAEADRLTLGGPHGEGRGGLVLVVRER